MKEISAPAMSVDPTNIAVQFCETQKPVAWQHMLIGPQQQDWVLLLKPLLAPQQQATFTEGPGANSVGGMLCAQPPLACQL